MNNILKSFVIILITLLMILASCGGGGTPVGTFMKEVALSTTTSSNIGVFAASNSFRHYQILYKPADITGSGYIRSIYFNNIFKTLTQK